MIPDYQSLMLPLLRFAEDGKEHRFGELLESLAKQFGLTEAETTQLLPSGK
jgi:restriction system protein